jgi:exodeoxyribonuclease VII large subunit
MGTQRRASQGRANQGRANAVQIEIPFGPHTYTVSQLGAELRALLGEAFPGAWVTGEVQRLRESRNGHVFFELVEKGRGDEVVGKLEAVIWRTDFLRVRRELAGAGQRLAEGLEVRCLAQPDFYAPTGRLQLTVRDVDPVFSLGLLTRRRQETLDALAAAGLLERNKALPLPDVPLAIGLVTSHGSAAYHDFLATLRESGLGFRVWLVHAAVQGREAERDVPGALLAAARMPVDCVVLVRGGGARAELAVFDSRRIAEAIATLRVPVLTGLGHEIDLAVADLVAHSAVKTPTGVAELLVRRAEAAERRLETIAAGLAGCAEERLRRAGEGLGRAERGIAGAAARVARESARVGEAARLLGALAAQRLRHAGAGVERAAAAVAQSAPRLLQRRAREGRALADAIARRAPGQLRRADERCAALARVAAQLSPERVLSRGFSITRTAAGRVLRAPGDASPGERLVTQLAAGTVTSRVEEP